MTPRRRGFAFDLISLLRVSAMFITLALGGCSDDDDGPLEPGPSPSPSPSPSPTPTYPLLSHPQNVLVALEMAYSALDSTKYKEIFDSTYTGSSTDLADAMTIVVTYSDEARHIAKLARTPGLSASMELGSEVTWDRLDSDDPSHPEWSVIQITGNVDYEIRITDGPIPLVAVGRPGTFQEFTFKPTPNDSSPSDTLWTIVRWKETGYSEPGFP